MALFDEAMVAFKKDDRPEALDHLRQQLSRVSGATCDPRLLEISETGTKEECIEALTLVHQAAMWEEQFAD